MHLLVVTGSNFLRNKGVVAERTFLVGATWPRSLVRLLSFLDAEVRETQLSLRQQNYSQVRRYLAANAHGVSAVRVIT